MHSNYFVFVTILNNYYHKSGMSLYIRVPNNNRDRECSDISKYRYMQSIPVISSVLSLACTINKGMYCSVPLFSPRSLTMECDCQTCSCENTPRCLSSHFCYRYRLPSEGVVGTSIVQRGTIATSPAHDRSRIELNDQL